MNDLVSVIVPIYNVEKYLDGCLQSIERQTYTHLQVILVEDGSTDGSRIIAERFVCRNSGWELHLRPNGGLSAALNDGVRFVRGDYIAFVDSDDSIEPDFIDRLHKNAVEFGADIVCSNLGEKDVLLNPRQYWKLFPRDPLLCVARWNKLYRSSVFSESGYQFPEGRVGEDLFHAIALFRGCVSFFVSPWAGYHYRNNPESISHNHKLNDWLDILDGWIALSTFFRSLYENNEMAIYATNNAIEYFHKMRRSYPNAKAELKKGKKIVKNGLIWHQAGIKNRLRYLRFFFISK